MFRLSRPTKRKAIKAGMRRASGMTRYCPHCGAELLWEQDQYGLYMAMDYDKEPHVPHVFACKGLETQE